MLSRRSAPRSPAPMISTSRVWDSFGCVASISRKALAPACMRRRESLPAAPAAAAMASSVSAAAASKSARMHSSLLEKCS